MPVLMHILEKIIELRKKGKSSTAIAKETSLNSKKVRKYESEVRYVLRDINPYDYSYLELAVFAYNLGLSVFEAENILPDAKIIYSKNTPKEIRYEQSD